jgi:hypothetical protein
MNTPQILIEELTLSLARSHVKVKKWERIKDGTLIPSIEFEDDYVDERIKYWTDQVTHYAERFKELGLNEIEDIPGIPDLILTGIKTILKLI